MATPVKRKTNPGPCPDPQHYTLVKGKAGTYWRLKRGTLKPAVLNPAWEQSRAHTSISSPAARRILEKLNPFTMGLSAYGRAGAFSGLLRKSLNAYNRIDYQFFKDYDMQPAFPLGALLKNPFTTVVRNRLLYINIPLQHQPVQAHNRLVTDYFFEAILLYGDASIPDDLRVETDQSRLYAFHQPLTGSCSLSLHLPTDKLWMVWLKVSCLENDQPAAHPRHYGMKVVAVGGGGF